MLHFNEAQSRDAHDNLPELCSTLEALKRLPPLRDIEYRVDGREQSPFAKFIHDGREFGVVAHRGAKNCPLVPEQLAGVGRDRWTGCRAACHESAELTERAERGLPACLSDGIDDYVHAAFSGPRANLARDICRVVVECFVCAEFARAGEFGIAGRGNPDMRADVSGDLQRRDCNAPSDSLNQNVLIGAELSAGHQHSPGGQRRERKCRGLRDRRVARNAGDVRFGNYYTLRYCAGKVLSQQLEADAEGLLPAEAVFACSVADPGVDDDEFICSIHNSDGVCAHDPWGHNIDAGEASQDEQIQMIQGCRKYSDSNLTGSGLGNW